MSKKDIFTQDFKNPIVQKKKQGPNMIAMAMKYAPQAIQVFQNKPVLYSIIGAIGYIILSGVVLNLLLFFWFPYTMFSIIGMFIIILFTFKIRNKLRKARGKK